MTGSGVNSRIAAVCVFVGIGLHVHSTHRRNYTLPSTVSTDMVIYRGKDLDLWLKSRLNLAKKYAQF